MNQIENLLNLHQNLTKLQSKLQDHLYNAIQETDIQMEGRKSLLLHIKSYVHTILDEMTQKRSSILKHLDDIRNELKGFVSTFQQAASNVNAELHANISQISTKLNTQVATSKKLNEILAELRNELSSLAEEITNKQRLIAKEQGAMVTQVRCQKKLFA